jgi:hypothetical protein
MIFDEKIELKVYVYQHDFVSDIAYKLLHAHDFFCVFFLSYLLMNLKPPDPVKLNE